MGSLKLACHGGPCSRWDRWPRSSLLPRDKAYFRSPSPSYSRFSGRIRNHGCRCVNGGYNKIGYRWGIPRSMPKDEEALGGGNGEGRGELRDEGENAGGAMAAIFNAMSEENSAIVSACLVGLLTGVSVVVFNNAVHELRDFFWDGIPYRGASWLREEPMEATWQRTVLVPVFGGVLVGFLNVLRDTLEGPSVGMFNARVKAVLGPFFKSVAACITLGTGNSLGPEGPSVEIGSSIAKGASSVFSKNEQREVSLIAAGSAAGISAGFNAAVAGCFFAVESVLWPSPSNSSLSLPNTTSMVILSAVIASTLSEVGLGSEPAFKVPEYDFRSPSGEDSILIYIPEIFQLI